MNDLPEEVGSALTFGQKSGYGEPHDNATGMLTGTWVRNLSENSSTVSAYYYDAYGRMVQSKSTRHAGGYITTCVEYLFDGSVAKQLTVQGTDSDYVSERYRYTYDHAGRTKQVYYQLNNDAEIIISELSYDSIGRLAQNLLHNSVGTIRYTYDMRNMLTETNSKHFSEKLYYADNLPEGANPCRNGNIAAIHTAYADSADTFAYTYDGQNRLRNSRRLVGYGSFNSELFEYDDAGNISSLKRFNDFKLIDDLTYRYTENNEGHQLLSVRDDGEDADRYNIIEYPNGGALTDTIMRYDANGNMVCDAARGISAIRYNRLNLPDTIQFVNGGKIVNFYDAAGRKYKSITYTNTASVIPQQYDFAHYSFETDSLNYHVTEYAGNIELHKIKDTALTTFRRIHNTIGYYDTSDSTYFHYIKDHLGNICAVVNSTADTVVQRTMYYASGVPMAESWGRDTQPYLYNGKEFVEAHGLNTYDYGFRGYYATIGRFTSIDPLAEQTPWQSPYVYANNNFINKIDYMGLSGDDSFAHDNSDIFVDGDRYGFGGGLSNLGWGIWSWSMLNGIGVQTLNYIITDEEGIILDADLTSSDKGIYVVNRAVYEGYVKNVINGNRLLFAQTLGTQIGVHRDDLKVVLRGTIFDQSWYNLGATLGIVNSIYIPTPSFTPEPVTGKICSAEMPRDAYMKMILDSQGQFQNMDYLQYYNSFERGMITNPVIQGVAVGGLGVMVAEETSLFYVLLQNSVHLQYGVGFIEGLVKALIPGMDYTPYLYGSPSYQMGSDAGNIIVNFFRDYL